MRVVSDSYRLSSFGKVAKGIPDPNKYSSYITHVLLVSLSSSGTPVGFCVLCQLGVKSTFSDFCDRCAKDLPSRHKLRSVFTPDMRGTPKMGATRSNKGGALSSSQGGGGGNNTTGGTSAGASTATMGTMDVRDPLGIGDIFGSTNRSVISCFVLEYLLCSRMIPLESSRYPTLKSALFESSVPFVESVAVWHELYSPNVMFPRHRSFPHLPTHFLARALCNPRTSISTMFIHHLPLVSIPYNTCPYTCPYTYSPANTSCKLSNPSMW